MEVEEKCSRAKFVLRETARWTQITFLVPHDVKLSLLQCNPNKVSESLTSSETGLQRKFKGLNFPYTIPVSRKRTRGVPL